MPYDREKQTGIYCFVLTRSLLSSVDMAHQIQLQGGFRNIQLVKSEETSLGIGSYGAVYRAKCDQLVCAAKVLHPILFQTRDPAAYRIVERFQQEIECLSGLRHPNIIQYLGSCADPDSGLPVLFMELMDESLTSFLERPVEPPPLPLYVQVDIGHDVVQALSHLHRHEVLHRDLSSNNVLLIGSRRAKVTDFGMAKLLGSDPRLTPTYCPGTNGYMSPEAMTDPPTYTSKLDVFSCGVLLVQLITRKFPDPGPRTYTVPINDPRFPSGMALMVVPELERRKEHLDLILPTHPLLDIALDCLKDKEDDRPTAEQLCSRLIALKESVAYRESIQPVPPQGATGQAPLAGHQELEQQLRESELRVENLTREVQQLQLQKHEHIQQRMEEIQQVQQQNQQSKEMVTSLKAELQGKVALLQDKDKQIQELEQRVSWREGSCVATGPLQLKWREGPPAPFPTHGHSVAVSENKIYCCDGFNDTKVLVFNSETEQWTILSECPRKFFSLAVINGQPTSVGGEQSGKTTNTLLSFTERDLSQRKWIEQYPPMTHCRSNSAVASTSTSLIVAGGWEGFTDKLTSVEVMDTQTLLWCTVASLPFPLYEATAAICEDRLYLGGGLGSKGKAKSVVVCKLKNLLPSQSRSLATRLHRPVWKEVASLPDVKSSLVAFHGQLLAVGGGATASGADSSSGVRRYDATNNSWNVISQMRGKRHRSFAAVLPNGTLFVCGGFTPDGPTVSVEVTSV